MTTSSEAVPSRWRRASAWVARHPKVVGVVYTGLGVVWIVVTLLMHEPNRLTLPVLFTLAGLTWFGRASLRLEGEQLIVPNRFWGGRRIDVVDIASFEVPTSVWSVQPNWVVLTSGERIILRGTDRDVDDARK